MQLKTSEYILTSKLVPEVIKVMMSQVWPSWGADSLRDSGRTRGVAEVAVSRLASGTHTQWLGASGAPCLAVPCPQSGFAGLPLALHRKMVCRI